MEGEREIDSKKKYAGLQQAKKEKKFGASRAKNKNSDSTAFQYTGIGHTE